MKPTIKFHQSLVGGHRADPFISEFLGLERKEHDIAHEKTNCLPNHITSGGIANVLPSINHCQQYNKISITKP